MTLSLRIFWRLWILVKSYAGSKKNGNGTASGPDNPPLSAMVKLAMSRHPRKTSRSIKIPPINATSAAGTLLEILGNTSIKVIAMTMWTQVQPSRAPESHSPAGFFSQSSCARNMTTARPLQKPTFTTEGTNVSNLLTSKYAITSSIRPASITDMKSSSTPSCPTSPTYAAVTEAKAAAEPLIIPGRPPKRAQTPPTIQAPWRPVAGVRCAMAAKATLAGTWAKQTMKLATSSSLHSANVRGPHHCAQVSDACSGLEKLAKLLDERPRGAERTSNAGLNGGLHGRLHVGTQSHCLGAPLLACSSRDFASDDDWPLDSTVQATSARWRGDCPTAA
mmetsp:Transcript_101868/g.287396  ORF Transcript_101868/g.287396 Transcript_101868/m.287396 type:complete len:334 (-) Transcript_101868:444-1445(-)